VSKRDDDSQADMEVGMTTAERRRRRRRGGGLRVPSDNVPRRTTPPVVPPVPEDPSLAMSIAYSFSSDASEPVPRVTVDTPSGKTASAFSQDPIAPEAMATVIDPPIAQVETADFEMKTREMSAVDLEALGLSEQSSITTTDPGLPGMGFEVRFKDPSRNDTERPSDVEIDVQGLDGAAPLDGADSDSVPTTIPSESSSEPGAIEPPARMARTRLKTVALTEEDLEEVREAVRGASIPHAVVAPPLPPVIPPLVVKPPAPAPTPVTNKTMPLAPIDIEVEKSDSDEPILGSGEIDIQELSDRAAESSGEIEVDVMTEDGSGPVAAAPPVTTEPPRRHTPSHPPPPTTATNPTGLPVVGAHPHAHPPPPPPAAQHKSPPAPPPTKPKEQPTAARVEKAPSPTSRTANDSKLSPRGKPWFVDLFDEDYLRTLPFLTPQATQAEAEFVINAMGLTPGAQVLDIGCGYGRHAMELAGRGFHVVGLDLSTPLLVRGGEEAHRRGLQINFVRGDMRELDFESQFDGAYCLFSTFGYFDDEMNKKTIANIARALKPGGRVMIEILNRDYLISDLPTRVWWEGDGCVVLEEVELNYFSSRIQVNRSVVFDDGRQLEQEISVRAYSLHEVGKLMHAAGFRVLEVSGGYHTRGRFFGNQSRHIIVLAERKEVSTSTTG
jgi:SAM-dependent methyltransferase